MKQFLNHNGFFLPADEPVVKSNNRSFCYGDGLFETIRIANCKPQFLKEHIERLSAGMRILKMNPNPEFSELFFEKAILDLAKKNGITSDGRVRLTVYRNEGGFYAPTDNNVSFLLEITPLTETGYTLNSRGITVDLFTDVKKSQGALSAIKSANSMIYVLAGIFKNTHSLDDCILVNDKGCITEAISSNIFAVKNGVLYTSPISDGCVDGVMRKKIMQIAEANRIAVYELSVMQSVLLGADELFLTNAISGIRWVVAYKQKRYFNNTSKKLTDKLNQMILEELDKPIDHNK